MTCPHHSDSSADSESARFAALRQLDDFFRRVEVSDIQLQLITWSEGIDTQISCDLAALLGEVPDLATECTTKGIIDPRLANFHLFQNANYFFKEADPEQLDGAPPIVRDTYLALNNYKAWVFRELFKQEHLRDIIADNFADVLEVFAVVSERISEEAARKAEALENQGEEKTTTENHIFSSKQAKKAYEQSKRCRLSPSQYFAADQTYQDAVAMYFSILALRALDIINQNSHGEQIQISSFADRAWFKSMVRSKQKSNKPVAEWMLMMQQFTDSSTNMLDLAISLQLQYSNLDIAEPYLHEIACGHARTAAFTQFFQLGGGNLVAKCPLGGVFGKSTSLIGALVEYFQSPQRGIDSNLEDVQKHLLDFLSGF